MGVDGQLEVAVLLLAMNVMLVLLFVAGWVAFILWKGVLKDILEKLEEAIDTNNKILARTFEEDK